MNRILGLKRVNGSEMGCTLWELMLVLGLMGILLSVVVPHFSSSATYVRSQIDLANIEKIEGAVQLYRIDVGTFPVSISDLVQWPRSIKGWRGPYLQAIPISPYSESGYQLNSLGQVIK
ncbi:type II secretion system protein G (GspG) [Desulfosporosinus acidiphilus SJ4]|uniref:Type II secretion system protein G (GspG) n=1 Tax=Desulfosporosinus acidiphilus (strain DSM 22704 / JCM 16185 / SJ4) TaxID=646529 RepID=I4D8Z1_DESAJ|nr:type II secretion system protein GspG [Desulfosporosinus acidiphilus]AFM42265.1 type II secretion system protein G (GspG) [Desulfosporosinus acidiphilus SJ4]